ncbi:hypothetical protein [Acinetobacter soli]|uniref:hypothetical protein n=1 Tax=Acinetobacter soli TaxID=487316 RepID=UPI000469CAC2|nr:hypothetical protein [Acinetobacter soli]
MYEETISSLKDLKTISSHIKNLGTIMNKSEDQELKKLLAALIMDLQKMHVRPDFRYKSTPLNLINGKNSEIEDLINYCKKFIIQQKPEWQVLAERNGWSPKLDA